MRIADRGLRNRAAEDSCETEEESSVRSNGRRSIPQSAIRNPHFLRGSLHLLLAVIPGQPPIHHNGSSGDVVRIG
jgi:hypothetical protein